MWPVVSQDCTDSPVVCSSSLAQSCSDEKNSCRLLFKASRTVSTELGMDSVDVRGTASAATVVVFAATSPAGPRGDRGEEGAKEEEEGGRESLGKSRRGGDSLSRRLGKCRSSSSPGKMDRTGEPRLVGVLW